MRRRYRGDPFHVVAKEFPEWTRERRERAVQEVGSVRRMFSSGGQMMSDTTEKQSSGGENQESQRSAPAAGDASVTRSGYSVPREFSGHNETHSGSPDASLSRMAQSMDVVAAHHAYQHTIAREDKTVRSRLRRLLRSVLSAKVIIGLATATATALWAYQAFAQQQQASRRVHVQDMFTSARDHLASPHAAIRANAVRTIREVAFTEAVIEPKSSYPGSFLLSYIRGQIEYPLHAQCRTLLHEYAMQERLPNSMENNIVSSALLESGVDWFRTERRLGIRVGANAAGSLLFKAQLTRAHGIALICDTINFGAADLRLVNLSNSSLRGCGLQGAALGGSILNGCDLVEAVLSETEAEGADFSFATCERAFFVEANLRGARFKQTDLSGAQFTGATLDGAIFNQANLSGTSFRNSSLKGAVFSQTDVSTADFTGADLEGADFTAAVGVSKVRWDSAVNADKVLLGNRNP